MTLNKCIYLGIDTRILPKFGDCFQSHFENFLALLIFFYLRFSSYCCDWETKITKTT